MKEIFIPRNHQELRSLEGKLVSVDGPISKGIYYMIYKGIKKIPDEEYYEFIDVPFYLYSLMSLDGNKTIRIQSFGVDQVKFGLNAIILPTYSEMVQHSKLSKLEYWKENETGYDELRNLIKNYYKIDKNGDVR